ncbi:FeoA domain-containing protein [Ruania suaedae]|uniref:metal-dependent transcriptional regulator n=1 Tax=Ruania suaedae TaxID=2897774 RepID=UPI001E557CEE|nr:metal-dependent transcriptional regulator [Ruania suaedae]UFU03626.1 FeoA domain-containing protein [Ruania suaedae]
MSDLIDTTEMYLKTVFELIEEGIVPLRARIAERLGHSGPTVSQTVARLERDGLMIVTGDRHLELTDEGMTRATRVMRKHRLAERLLTDVIGLDWPHVHEEACRWEHVMSRQVEERLIALLDHPGFDPYGNPIPGLEEFGEASRPEMELGTWLTDVPAGVDYVLTRLGEPLQVDTEMLAELEKAGVRPGVRVAVGREAGVHTLAPAGSDVVLELSEDVAKHVFVRPA